MPEEVACVFVVQEVFLGVIVIRDFPFFLRFHLCMLMEVVMIIANDNVKNIDC